jgi:hypothetical protein
MYTIEHLVATFFVGLIIGVVSTVFFTQRSLTLEKHVAFLIMSIWLSMHVYSFFFGNEVDWIFNLVGFGAVGTFVGINLRSVNGVADMVRLLKK